MSNRAIAFLDNLLIEDLAVGPYKVGDAVAIKKEDLDRVVWMAYHAIELAEFGSGCSTREDPVCMEEFPKDKEEWCRNCLAIEAYQKTVEGLNDG